MTITIIFIRLVIFIIIKNVIIFISDIIELHSVLGGGVRGVEPGKWGSITT